VSRFKHALMGAAVAVALVAVPAVPALARQTAAPTVSATSTAAGVVTPDCGGCWQMGGS